MKGSGGYQSFDGALTRFCGALSQRIFRYFLIPIKRLVTFFASVGVGRHGQYYPSEALWGSFGGNIVRVIVASLIPPSLTEEVQELDPPVSLSQLKEILGTDPTSNTLCKYTDDNGGCWFWLNSPQRVTVYNERVQDWLQAGIHVYGLCLYLSKREYSNLRDDTHIPPPKVRIKPSREENLDALVKDFKPKPWWVKV